MPLCSESNSDLQKWRSHRHRTRGRLRLGPQLKLLRAETSATEWTQSYNKNGYLREEKNKYSEDFHGHRITVRSSHINFTLRVWFLRRLDDFHHRSLCYQLGFKLVVFHLVCGRQHLIPTYRFVIIPKLVHWVAGFSHRHRQVRLLFSRLPFKGGRITPSICLLPKLKK